MSELKYLSDTSLTKVIDDDSTLADGTRTERDLECDVYLQVQYDSGPPSVDDEIAQLWVMPGDGEASEVFPEGGDAGLGTDDDPQNLFYIGSFTSVNPSLTVNEILCIPDVPLRPHGNRFVLKNVSGQTFDSTWELRIKPRKFEIA